MHKSSSRKGNGMTVRAIVFLMLLLVPGVVSAADSLSPVDSLLARYERASHQQKAELAQTLFPLCLEGDEVAPAITLPESKGMPADSIDLLVFFVADRYYYNTGGYTRALSYIDRALPLCSAPKTGTRAADIRATMLADRGYLLSKTGQMSKATEASQEAVKFAKKTGNLLQLSRAYLYLSIINFSMQQSAEAIDFVEKSIETNQRLGLNNQTHNAYGVACEIYSFAKQTEKAIDYGQRAVEAARAVGSDAGVANHLSQLSYAYNRSGDYQHGLEAAQQAVSFAEQMSPPDRNLLAVSIVYKAHNLIDLKRYREAADEMRRAIAIEKEIGNARAVCYDYSTLSEALSHYDSDAALQAMKRYAQLADSLHLADLHEALGKANAEFKNDELKQENAEARQHNRSFMVASAILAAIMLLAIGILIYAMRLKSRSNEALRNLNRARESFFTNITHEFRTPLTLILGMSRKVKAADGKDIKSIHDSADIIERNGNRLLGLISQLLDISKVQAHAAQPDWRNGNIVAYLDMLVENYQLLANEKGIELTYAPENRSVKMNFVSDYVQKVVGNLLSNAIKFTPKYGRIYMTTRCKDGQFVLTVADNGCGIALKDQPHIFGPFYQAEGTQSEQSPGTGVGLFLVSQIVDSLDGTVGVESAPGKGSVFTVTLPITTEAKDVSTPLNSDGSQTVGGDPDSQLSPLNSQLSIEPRVLIVEDNSDLAYYIETQLDGTHQVFHANNGRVGFEKAEALVPDLIITDLMMPEMDGLELCRRVRQSDIINHVPIIVITAKATDEERIQGIEAGADAYLYKPFSREELNMRASKLLEQRQLLREKYSQAVNAAATADSQTSDTHSMLDDSNMSDADKKFFGRITNLVYSLMKHGNVDVDTVASELCMSPSQFRRKFTSLTGITPAVYINKLRMSNAQRLIDAHPDWTISQVAERCGFSDSAHFTNAFKRQFGITPSQYARRAR